MAEEVGLDDAVPVCTWGAVVLEVVLEVELALKPSRYDIKLEGSVGLSV